MISMNLPGAGAQVYSYDLQGNMLRLTRKGLTAPREYGLIDDVTATYTGNQLRILYDEAPQVLLEASLDVPEGEHRNFEYDANGNMTRDMSREITDMEYNALNLPCRVTFAGGSHIDWLYSAAGQKLRQTVISVRGDTLSRRDYLGPYLFTDNEFDRYETAEGYVTPDDIYHAYVPDNQGNIVGVVNTSSNTLEQRTTYYPYGLPFADSSNPTANRRKYGAKELTPDLGLNAYDFEARTLAPAFPAFAQPDPLAETYSPLSPYLYCAGNPINNIDPDGQRIWSFDENGYISLVSEAECEDVERFIFVDANSEQVKDGNGNPIQIDIDKNSVITLQQYREGVDFDVLQIRGDENGMNLYHFLSDIVGRCNEIEFSYVQTGKEGKMGLNFISTSHEISKEGSIVWLFNGQLANGYTMRLHSHSHPSGSGPSQTDKEMKIDVTNFLKEMKRYVPKFSIYSVPKQREREY